jgi:hypothetical protein
MKMPVDSGPLEIELYNILAGKPYEAESTAYLYSEIKDPIDKFLFLYVFEMGKTRKEAEIATGLCKVTVWKRIKLVKKSLSEIYQNKRMIEKLDNI